MANLIMFVVGWAAHWQRRNILRCTAIGRKRAMERGVKFGRKPKLTAQQPQDIAPRFAAGDNIRQLVADYQVSESTLARVRRTESSTATS
ncbi:hypothetical protein NKI94_29270 [Mesorhizobium australicum]|uniref:hypothetical protein n=1 Tax=Mesorhizobium australicum TaxID=536018 RepID=UPI003334F6C9